MLPRAIAGIGDSRGATGSDNPNGSTEIREESEEAQEHVTKKHGYRPNQAEVDARNVAHLPFRNWCPACVAGKADNDPHYQQQETDWENMEIDEIGMDYAYMEPRPGTKANNEEETDEGPEGSDRKSLPILVCSSRKTKWIRSTVAPQKGVCPSAAQTLAKDIGDMGYKRVTVKNVQEESIRTLREAVGRLKNIENMKKESPVGESASIAHIVSLVKLGH